jgi:hypothetical protein
MHSELYKKYTIRQKIAVVAAMIHGILFSLYGNCHDKNLSPARNVVRHYCTLAQKVLTFSCCNCKVCMGCAHVQNNYHMHKDCCTLFCPAYWHSKHYRSYSSMICWANAFPVSKLKFAEHQVGLLNRCRSVPD